MKKFLVAVGLLAITGGAALAGVNANGTIFAHDANLVYTTDTLSYCNYGSAPTSCEGADTQIESTGSVAHVFKVYAAFCPPPHDPPRLKAMTFGVYYPDDIVLATGAFGPCVGDLNNGGGEIQGPGWPGNNTGTAIVFQDTQTTILVQAYWFAGYTYYGTPAVFTLGPHPDPVLGGMFADDSIPSVLDPIAGFGTLGFNTAGRTACPDPARCENPPPLGACCFPDGHCEDLIQSDCGTGDWREGVPCTPELCPPQQIFGACCYPDGTCQYVIESECNTGDWRENVPCEPDNPCPIIPVHPSTWGQIKANYR